MRTRPKAWISWSTGKDSAWALRRVRESGEIEVVAMLTTVNISFGRVAMHAVRESILEAQAEAAGLPLVKVPIPWPCPNEAYEAAMSEAIARATIEGITHMTFGDLFLEDVRSYREEKLGPTGITPVFPLWGRDTRELAREMTGAGLRAVITSVDPTKLHPRFAGRIFDDELLADISVEAPGVDPCGENGEFHTCVFAGPMFSHPLAVKVGEVVHRDGFVFADVLPA